MHVDSELLGWNPDGELRPAPSIHRRPGRMNPGSAPPAYALITDLILVPKSQGDPPTWRSVPPLKRRLHRLLLTYRKPDHAAEHSPINISKLSNITRARCEDVRDPTENLPVLFSQASWLRGAPDPSCHPMELGSVGVGRPADGSFAPTLSPGMSSMLFPLFQETLKAFWPWAQMTELHHPTIFCGLEPIICNHQWHFGQSLSWSVTDWELHWDDDAFPLFFSTVYNEDI